jgi:hypothetical protein
MLDRLDTNPAQLRKGCVLATIAHAIFTAHNPELANEQSWDGPNYSVQDSQGALGTVTFEARATIGAFFDAHSERNPLASGAHFDLSTFLAEVPADVRSLADEETLQYLLQDYEGATVPVVTSVFWSDHNELVAPEPWPEAFANGAHLIQTQLRTADEAIEAWRSHYDLSPQQVELLRSLFAGRTSTDGAVVMSHDEKAALLEQGDEGLEESRELLASVGITVPT